MAAAVTDDPAWAVRFPELFAGMSEQQKWNVHNTIASHVLEGWAPEREDIADLTVFERGDIDRAEYVRRGLARVSARFRQTVAPPPSTHQEMNAMADEPLTPQEQRILAAANAGEVMETGTELAEGDIAAALRVLRGQSTPEEEAARVLAEIRAARENRENDDA